MSKNTSVSLGSYFDSFVEKKISAMKTAIQEGVNSGIATGFEPHKYLEFLKVNRRRS